MRRSCRLQLVSRLGKPIHTPDGTLAFIGTITRSCDGCSLGKPQMPGESTVMIKGVKDIQEAQIAINQTEQGIRGYYEGVCENFRE